jgi:hypothetical protein
MIEIQGLSPKQMALADIMWSISDRDGVESFISTLPRAEAQTCRVLIELMQLAFIDECDNTLEAEGVLVDIMYK